MSDDPHDDRTDPRADRAEADPSRDARNGSGHAESAGTTVAADSGAPVDLAGPDRLAMPIDVEQSPRLAFVVVGVGASAGGLEAYAEFLRHARPDSGMAFVLIQHLSPKHESIMADLLAKHTAMPVLQVEDGMPVEPNHVYVIRPGHTMTIRDGRLHLGASAADAGHRRPVDDFFRSLAEEQRERAICVILSGTGSNGTAGAQQVKAVGGICIAQDPETAKFNAMPRSLIESGSADAILPPAEMFEAIARFASHPYISGPPRPAKQIIDRERLALGEIIALLRTRTRHDFTGYKKPTLVRRIQRRMSLLQIGAMAEYARTLRQSPGEVASLADDLMIHVTGFFRDPEAWEALRTTVIEPLVNDRADEGPIRAWVTACSSGEEAYTLAILLVEAAEARGKHFEIKVFATDTADRSLAQARAGVYAGGIESEVTPARLARFFEREDAHYRVRKELRELVVFAPQNVLQDPPFSRLDLCTCRNLLIYIEPEVQRRALAMMHFGLREGGALLLGSSETVTGAEELFEPIDKRHRLYRRVGPTRHGEIGFAFPAGPRGRGRSGDGEEAGDLAEAGRRTLPRSTIAQLTNKLLLERQTPAAVVVDRAGQIVFYHGDTGRFLDQPRGEPTRDLLQLTREEVRGAARTALHRALDQNAQVQVRDGLLGEGEDRRRVEISVIPLEQRPVPSYFVVSFTERPEPPPPPAIEGGDADGRAAVLADDLRRVRDELQSTVEELQTSNEEMRASNEEVTSINEELQSANEELETSKEELQSLNEELTTVNGQLSAKMEELERTASDLASLLSSTNIAVLFLDAALRIRRFTPAVLDLIELIAADVGRPLSDLNLKFVDPDLVDDARRVLDQLTPIEREVLAGGGRSYLRRVLPYRSIGNRIDGVVVTFVDVTARLAAERASRDGEARLRALYDQANVGIAQTDLAGRFVHANARYCQILGRTLDQTLAIRIADVVHPDDAARCAAAFERLLATGESFTLEKRYVRPDGEVTWVRHSMSLVRDEAGVARFAVAVSEDQTAIRAAADLAAHALGHSEEQFRMLVEGARDFALIKLDVDGNVQAWNSGAERLLGYASGEVLGRSFALLFAPEDRVAGAPEQELARAIADGSAPDDRWLVRRGGERFFGSGMLTTLRELDGAPRGFVKVIRDDTERKRTEETLLAAKDAAESANRLKDEFLATLSHELRTPLTAIKIWAKLLRAPGSSDEHLAEGLDAIELSAESQRQLIEDLLDSSRITSGKMRLEVRDADLAGVVREAIDTIGPTAAAKDVTLAVDLGDDVGTVRVDPDRLRQVVWNLLTNAVKFTPAGGRVDVGLWREPGGVTIRVADDGRGIDPAFLPNIFDRFRQADQTSTRAYGGLGLGLAIVKQLVELHGGTIAAESAGPGKGSAFTVRLPLPKGRPARRATTPKPAAAAAATPRAVPPDLTGVRVLLVEDQADTRAAVASFLSHHGLHVVPTGGADAAIEAFIARRPDVLVSDIGLPGTDGIALIRKLRDLERAAGATPLPAIATTAFTRDQDRRDVLDAGFQRFLGKPFEPGLLLETIDDVLRAGDDE